MNLVHLVDKSRFGEWARSRLGSGLVVLAKAVVLVKFVSEPRRPVPMSTDDDHFKVLLQKNLVGLGLV